MDERARWARRVASLIRSGAPLADALDTARDETDSFELAGPLGYIARTVRGGTPLAEALSHMADVFAAPEVAAFAAARTAEDLAAALESLGPWEPPEP